MTEVRVLTLANGIELECEEAGQGARPLVLLHGFTGSRDDWREQLVPLSELGRTLALDQRGHGGSTNTGDPDSYTLDQLCEDLGQALDVLEIAECDLLGHSLGGMVTLRFALARPERVASLILMDTSARAMEMMPARVMEGSRKLVRQEGTGALAKLMRDAASGNPRTAPSTRAAVDAMGFDRWWDRIQKKLDQMDPEAFVALSLALGEQQSAVPRLGEISCPTTILVGEQDQPFLAPSEELESGIPDARLVKIPDAAHSPQLENPAAWLAAIRDHLARVRA